MQKQRTRFLRPNGFFHLDNHLPLSSMPPFFSLQKLVSQTFDSQSLRHPSQFHLSTSIIALRIDSSRKARKRIPNVLVRATIIDFSPAALKPPGRAVESDRLPSDVRRRAMDAVDSFGGRVTIGDVTSKAGLKLDEAQGALQALATDTDGFLEVSNEGDVLYVFPEDYCSNLAAKSVRMKVEPLFEKAKSASGFVVRVSFGTALIVSIVIVFLAILALVVSSKSDDGHKKRGNHMARVLTSPLVPQICSGYAPYKLVIIRFIFGVKWIHALGKGCTAVKFFWFGWNCVFIMC